MNANSTVRVKVEEGGEQGVAHVGLHALGAFADRLGLGHSLSCRIPVTGERLPLHDRGKVLVQAMLMLAGGGEACTDIEHLRAQERLFGSVASDSTLYRTLRAIDAQRLDLPEVSLVTILDADTEGFVRSETSLIQTIGRAARNVDGQVVMWADQITVSMHGPSPRPTGAGGFSGPKRRAGYRPQTIARRSPTSSPSSALRATATPPGPGAAGATGCGATSPSFPATSSRGSSALEEESTRPAADPRFEYAARLREEVADLKRELRELG